MLVNVHYNVDVEAGFCCFFELPASAGELILSRTATEVARYRASPADDF